MGGLNGIFQENKVLHDMQENIFIYLHTSHGNGLNSVLLENVIFQYTCRILNKSMVDRENILQNIFLVIMHLFRILHGTKCYEASRK